MLENQGSVEIVDPEIVDPEIVNSNPKIVKPEIVNLERVNPEIVKLEILNFGGQGALQHRGEIDVTSNSLRKDLTKGFVCTQG